MNEISLLNRAADNIRILAASMVEKAKSGHPGGAMGGADFINVLYSEFLRYDPADYAMPFRDRLFLDPGHMSPMLYAVLSLAGIMPLEELKAFRQWGSVTPGHPERVLAARFGEWTAHKTYAYISDGAVEEEISQGVGRIAGHLGLANLIMFYDSNNIQLSTECGVVMTEDTAAKYKAWGWNVMTINGNDAEAIRDAIKKAQKSTDAPTLIIGKTIMGKGALKEDGSTFEHNIKTHGAPLGGEAYANTIKNLGGDPTNPFVIFDDVKKLYANRREELKKIVAKRHAEEIGRAHV